MRQTKFNKAGFTLVELMLALAFLSFILILVLGGFLLITRNYNQGVTSARVHQAGRNLLEQMVREVRQSNSTPLFYRLEASPDGASQAFICYSGGTYRVWDQATNPDNYGKIDRIPVDLTAACKEKLKYDQPNNIRVQFDNISNSKTLLDRDEVYVTSIDFTPVNSSNELFNLELSLTTSSIVSDLGLDDNSDGRNETCNVSTSGSEFCDIVTLGTVLSLR